MTTENPPIDFAVEARRRGIFVRAAISAEDLAAMLVEHDATVAWFNRKRAPDWTEAANQDREEAVYSRAYDLRREIFKAPATSPEAFAVKLRLAVQLHADDILDNAPGFGDTLRQLLDFLERQGQPAAS